MSQQGAIAAGDHGARVPQQGFDGVAGGGVLPRLAVESGDVEDDLRDFPLGRAIAIAVEALQHPAQSQAVLRRQPGIRRDGPAVKGGQQTAKGSDTIESIPTQRNDGGKGSVDRRGRLDDELDTLAVTEIVEKDVFVMVSDAVGGIEGRLRIGVLGETRRSRPQKDGARIVRGQPDDAGFR